MLLAGAPAANVLSFVYGFIIARLLIKVNSNYLKSLLIYLDTGRNLCYDVAMSKRNGDAPTMSKIILNQERIEQFMPHAQPPIKSHAELARRADISYVTLKRAYDGENYTRDTLAALALALGRFPHDLELVEGFSPPLEHAPAVALILN